MKNFLYWEVPTMSLSLAYSLVIIPINILLKLFKTSRSLIFILCTSSDSEITSGRVNLESNEQYKCKVEQYSIWTNGSLACKKVLKLSDIWVADWANIAYSLLTGCLNAYTNLFSPLGFSSGLFTLGIKIRQNIISRIQLHQVLNHLLETGLISYLTSLLKFMNSSSWFVCFPLLIIYVNNKTLNIYRTFFGSLSSPQMC